jgi:hypothetical protein
MFELLKEHRSNAMALPEANNLLQQIWNGDAHGVQGLLSHSANLSKLTRKLTRKLAQGMVLNSDMRPVDLLEEALVHGGNPEIVKALLQAGARVERKHLGLLLDAVLPFETMKSVIAAAPQKELQRAEQHCSQGEPMVIGTMAEALQEVLTQSKALEEDKSLEMAAVADEVRVAGPRL